jgi:hypothetical protein
MTLEWPEEAGTKIEGKKRISLEEEYGLRLSDAPGAPPPPAEGVGEAPKPQPAAVPPG